MIKIIQSVNHICDINNPGIYKITNIINNKFYIGSAFNIRKRYNGHLSAFINNRNTKYLQRAYNKYGKNNFIFEILEYIQILPNETKKEFRKRLVYEKEQFYLDTLLFAQEYIRKENNKFKELGYNLSPTANSVLGIQRSQEFKEKCRISSTGKKASKETREKLSTIHKGRKRGKLLESTKLKLSEYAKSRNGSKNPFYNKTHSIATRKILSEKRKGKIPSNAIKLEYNNNTYTSKYQLYIIEFKEKMSLKKYLKLIKNNIIKIKILNK